MCGIAGFVSSTPLRDAPRTLRRMVDVIAHRGPDDAGLFDDAHVALGHRRLSIIDVAGGHQPMPNETGRFLIIYNGEVFNHADLRPALEQAGHVYTNRSDTETILHAYEEYGPDCVTRFRGMFAFAIWDKERRQLFCARDRMGIKPFYYHWDGRTLVFGSEIKALLEHPSVRTEFNESAIGEHLAFGYLSGEETMFRNIRKLMPGHHLTVRLDGNSAALDIQRYWDVPLPASEESRPDQDWIAECRTRLEETVRMRLMSDVPLGMFLSGGIDSAVIAAMIKRMVSGPVKTYSVGYRETQFSELSDAAETARFIGTEHREVLIGMEDLFNALPKLIWQEDEPLAWPSSIALYHVAHLASKEVKVVLTGEGSDELFGGYERYRWNLLNRRALSLYSAVPSGARGWIRSQISTSNLISASQRRKLGHTFLAREESVESLFLDNFYCAFSAGQQSRLLGSRSGQVYANYLHYWEHTRGASPLRRMLYADQKTYLVELLMKQDQMSMACSIESRVPFLDHHFVEFMMRVPDHLKIRNGTQKYLLKQAVSDLLPAGIIHRKKRGFPTPIRQWLMDSRADALYDALKDRDGFVAAWVDRQELNSLIERHRGGVEDCTDRIWQLLNLQLWGDLFITGKRDRWWGGILPVGTAGSAV